MPKLVKEITSGQSNERSADGGGLADTSVRTWRVILSSPAEAYDIQNTVGVKIGDLHPVNTSVPCVSISERPDGDSRVVRLVTATYRTTAGSSTATDPNTQPPDIRPARFTISSTPIELPADKWRMIENHLGQEEIGERADPLNPVNDRYDGVTVLEPLITISIEQFTFDATGWLDAVGDINSDDTNFGELQIDKHKCMLRSINVRPVVETFGATLYRGFTRSYEFAIHYRGWYIDQILEGFNIKNQNLNGIGVWNEGLNLQHDDGKVLVDAAGGYQLAANTNGKKMRAVIPITTLDGGWMQRPSAQPVALNIDGTPRNAEVDGVLRRKYVTQFRRAFGPNFVNLGVRIQDIL